jgi:hypothetical protein
MVTHYSYSTDSFSCCRSTIKQKPPKYTATSFHPPQSVQLGGFEDTAIMHTPKTISSDRPSKRLRLGTKSCFECRRRKVRCIFEPNSKVCKECFAHESECIPQQSVHSRKNGLGGDGQDVQQKLQSLEEMVYRLCEAMNARAESTCSSPFEMSAADALTRLQAPSSPKTSLGDKPMMEARWRAASESRSSSSSEQIESLEDAPLLSLFQEAMLIPRRSVQSDRNPDEFSSDHRTKIYIKAIKALVPSPDDLELVLKTTEKFWPIWEDCQHLVIGSEPHMITGIASAKKFVFDSMRSETPLLMGKSALFLALCVQQLPRSFKSQATNLPALPKTLLDSYIRAADSLLSINESRSARTESLECLTVLAKLYVNMGKPREGWHCFHRAFNSALLLGLHNQNETTPDRQKAIWAHIWQGDRQLSSLLGLPAATTDSHPGVSIQPAGQQIEQRIIYDLSVIAGHIIERNQNNQTADYSATLHIDQELQQCRSQIPSEWWNSLPSVDTPLKAIYGLGIIRLQFYTAQKMIHLPYMLKSSIDSNYEYSRLSALDASREIMRSYQMVRTHPDLALAICDVFDFQAFTGAVVIIIDLLSQSSQLETHQEAIDWDLIHNVTLSLKSVSKAMECTVAGQAAELLATLSTFRASVYSGPENYEVVIPMFGKVRINCPQKRTAQTEVNPLYSIENFQQQFIPTLEFSANSFAPFGMTGDILSDTELGIDWTSILNVDTNYDWSQTVSSSVFG